LLNFAWQIDISRVTIAITEGIYHNAVVNGWNVASQQIEQAANHGQSRTVSQSRSMNNSQPITVNQ